MSDSLEKWIAEARAWANGDGCFNDDPEGEPLLCVYWAQKPFLAKLDRLESLARQHREEVAQLQASLDTLHGAKFSDRCYHALKSRAECAEAALAKTTAPAEPVPYIELALYEDDRETQYPGYHRVRIPYDAWSWEIDHDGLLTNRTDIVFPESTGNYYKAPLTYICTWIDGKRQIIKLSRALALGPPAITPVFKARQLSLATDTTHHG